MTNTAITKKDLNKLQQDPQFQKLHTILNRFNIFSALNIEHVEIRHSNVLAWLLNPQESHGLKNFPLSYFLTLLKGEKCTVKSALVKREAKLGKKGQIDLLLDLSNGEILAIENKIYSREGKNQLRKYRDILEKTYKNKIIHFLFLTPVGSSYETDDKGKWTPRSYEIIVNLLEEVLKRNDLNKGVKIFLEHYMDIIKREVLMETQDIEQLCTDLYSHYADVFNAVMEYKQDGQTQLKNYLIDSLKNNWKKEFVLDRAFKNSITFYMKNLEHIPCLEIDDEVMYGGWKQPKNALTFEFKVQSGKLILKLMILKTKNDFKEFLLNQIKSHNIFKKVKTGDKWLTVWQESILDWEKYDTVLEIDMIKDKVKSFMDRFLSNTYPKIKKEIESICQEYERENAQ